MTNKKPRINTFDFEEYVKSGGKVRDLINPQIFEAFYKKLDHKKLGDFMSQFAFYLVLTYQIYLDETNKKAMSKLKILRNGTRIGQP